MFVFILFWLLGGEENAEVGGYVQRLIKLVAYLACSQVTSLRTRAICISCKPRCLPGLPVNSEAVVSHP